MNEQMKCAICESVDETVENRHWKGDKVSAKIKHLFCLCSVCYDKIEAEVDQEIMQGITGGGDKNV